MTRIVSRDVVEPGSEKIGSFNVKREELCWDDSAYLSLIEDDTVFGPDGAYGWFMSLWHRFWV